MKDKIWQFLLVIIPIPLTFWIGGFYERSKDDTVVLEYLLRDKAELLNIPDGLRQDVSVTYKGSPAEGLSSVTVALVNRSGRSLDNVSIFLSSEQDGGRGVPSLVSRPVGQPSKYPDKNVEYIGLSVSENKRTDEWLIRSFNSSFDAQDTIRFTLVYLGRSVPRVTISLIKPGVDLAPYDFGKSSPRQTLMRVATVTAVILVYFGLVFGVVYVGWRRDSKRRMERRRRVVEYIMKEFPDASKDDVLERLDIIENLFEPVKKGELSSPKGASL